MSVAQKSTHEYRSYRPIAHVSYVAGRY